MNQPTPTEYEAPALQVVGSLEDLTKGGAAPNNELPNQQINQNDAFPPVSA